MGDLARPAEPTDNSQPTPTVPDLSPIDPDAIANLRELNPGDNGEFLREIIGIYIEDTPKRIADLKACLASGDTSAFTRAAHTIKGSSANVGARRSRSWPSALSSSPERRASPPRPRLWPSARRNSPARRPSCARSAPRL